MIQHDRVKFHRCIENLTAILNIITASDVTSLEYNL